MPEAILVNGRPVGADEPAVPALDPGLLGHGVYESIRTYGGVPFALDRHLERLAAGAAALDIACPVEELAAEVADAVARLGHGGETRIRIVLTAGGTRVVSADPLPDRSGDRERRHRGRLPALAAPRRRPDRGRQGDLDGRLARRPRPRPRGRRATRASG